MATMPDTAATFADTLRRAIDQRGLSLDRIQAHLGQRGAAVSVATLSYWKSGRSAPARTSSLVTLRHLEHVLDLEEGALMSSLPPTQGRERRRQLPELESLWAEDSPAAVLGRLDTRWDAALDRVMLHDRLRVGSDRRHLGLTVRQAMRARTDGPDRRVVVHQQDDLTGTLPRLEALRGCRTGRVERDPDGGVIGAELLFCQPLRRGETVIVEYELTWDSPGPADVEYTRRLRTPLRELLMEVEFDPAAPPESVTAFTPERERAVATDLDHRATVAHTDSAPGTVGLRWGWPETGPDRPS